MIADCPDVKQLEAFLDGRESDQLAEHIAGCSNCAEKMESLLDGGRFNEATTKDQLNPYLNEPKYAELKKWTQSLVLDPSSNPLSEMPKKIGRYEVRRFLGNGSFGDVYSVYDPRFNIERAVKVLRSGLFATERSRDQFLAEARYLAKVSHPGLVDVRDVEIDLDQPFIVMKLIDGETLEKRLRRSPLDIATTVQIMIKVAHAAHHAHEAELVHRDLKPANILLDQQQNPVIADFGLVIDQNAQDNSDPSLAGEGTKPYMSPEQYSGPPAIIDSRSDIWALGVILAEMLHGQRPFPQRDREALKQAICAEEPVLPSGKQFVELNRIVKRCLAKFPFDRYPSAAELANDLIRWSRRHSPKWYVRWQYGWRRNLVIGTSFLLLLAAVWAGQLWASREKTLRMISELESADSSQILWRVSGLADLPGVLKILKDRPVPPNDAAKYRVNLAIAACGGDGVDLWTDLADYLQSTESLNEIDAAVRSLREKPNCLELVNVAVKRLLEKQPEGLPESPSAALRLAAIVAGLRPEDPVWPKINTQIANELVGVPEQDFDRWLDFFQQVGANQLSPELLHQMTSKKVSDKNKNQYPSARALAAFFENNAVKLVELLVQADWDELEPFVNALRKNSDLARNEMRGRFDGLIQLPRPLPPNDNAHPSDHDVKTARLAVALWQLGDRHAACHALRHDPEPTLQTLVIFGLSKQPIDVKDVVAELGRVRIGTHEVVDGIKFGLLQILSLQSPTNIANAVSKDWLNQLFLNDTDSGVHAMSGLLADKLGFSLTRPNPGQHGNWMVGTVGGVNMDFVVIDRPTFQAGIKDNKEKVDRKIAWSWHKRNIPRRFAIGAREITFEQLRQYKRFADTVPAEANDAAAVGVFLQDAYGYCNWCSRRAGLEPCYESDPSDGGPNNLIPRKNHLCLSGYRLPTEGEWECACRAGTETGRFFGQMSSDENLFCNYDWLEETPNKLLFGGQLISQPVGQLLPNRWGLFDMYGNVRELCGFSTPVDDEHPVTIDDAYERARADLKGSRVPNVMRMVVRSLYCGNPGMDYAFSHCRSEGIQDGPSCGIRIARTLVESGRD